VTKQHGARPTVIKRQTSPVTPPVYFHAIRSTIKLLCKAHQRHEFTAFLWHSPLSPGCISTRRSVRGVSAILWAAETENWLTQSSLESRYLSGFGGVVVSMLASGNGVPRGWGVLGVPRPPKFRSFEKAEPNSQFRGIYVCNNLIRIWVSLICKLSGTPD
jgi:hypothetical protein